MTKLLFFIDTGLSGGGAEKVLCTLVNNLDKSRFDITVMTSWPQDAGRYLAPGIHYRALYPARNRFWHLVSRAEAALGLTYRLRMAGAYDLESAYLEFGPTKILASSTNRRAKKLAWVHCDLILKSEDPQAFARKSGPWYQKFDHVVCVSGQVEQSFRRLFPDAPPSSVLYNINDEDEILDKADAFVPEKRDIPTLCAVGRLSAEKGFDRLLLSCKRLKREGIPFHLQIIGEGDQRPRLEELIEKKELHDCVELLGWQDNPYPYMKAADIIVCSSRYEGLSTVITEALILGKPVVTTPCTGMTELLGDSAYGLIAGEDDDALHRALRRMLTEPGLREHYADASARRGRDFQKEVLVRKTEAFFTELLEGTRSE